MGTMDSLDTWPRPIASDDGSFDAAVLRQVRSASRPQDTDGGTGTTAEDAHHPGRGVGAVTALALLAVPVLVVVALVVLIQQLAAGAPLWGPVLIGAGIVAALVWEVSLLRRALATVRTRLGPRIAQVVDHGVGMVRELELTPVPGPEDDGRVRARLDLSVNPVRGARFRTVVEAVYDAEGAARLHVGSHGPVRFLRDAPEGSTRIDVRLSEAQVQQVYRAAALN